MENWRSEFPKAWRILDSSSIPLEGEALFPFAMEEAECREIGVGALPLIHIWRHRRAFILGLRDRKLPQVREATDWLNKLGYAAAVRHSGGAAVPLDEGVINVSLILPNPPGTLQLHRDFSVMAGLVGETVRQLAAGIKVDIGEVKGSYCPGEFDLAVEGYKFCGIAQRRQTGAFILQAFIVVEGVGMERARLAADFYRYAGQGGNVSNIPLVTEQSTRSLQEMIESVSVERFVQTIKVLLTEKKDVLPVMDGYKACDKQQLAVLIAQMKQRYDSG